MANVKFVGPGSSWLTPDAETDKFLLPRYTVT